MDLSKVIDVKLFLSPLRFLDVCKIMMLVLVCYAESK